MVGITVGFLAFLAATMFALGSAQSALCPGPNGDFPNPNSEQCTTFFRCVQGNPALLRCPTNQRFDFLFRICRQQRLVDCNNQLQVFAAPATSPGFGGLAGRSGVLPGIGGIPGLGALGSFGGAQLGAGLPDGGLLTLLSQLSDGQNGSNSNNLATVLMMSALMNRRNAGNQQGPPSPYAGPAPFYPSNDITPALLPDQSNNPNWQQPGGNYATTVVGASQGNTITLADGKTYILVPQAQGSYVQASSPSQFATMISAASQGQTIFPAAQSQSILLDSSIRRESGQPQLQSMMAQPVVTEAGSGTPTTEASSNNTSNATTS